MNQWPFRSLTRALARLGMVLAGLAVSTVATHAASFSATLDRDTMTLGESATLTLTFEGGQPSSISQPNIPNLQFVDRGSSQSINIVNNQMSTTISETFEVTARQPGDYTIPAFQVQMSGQALASQPLKLKVLKPGQPSPDAIQSGTEIGFMKLVLPRKEVYLGETFVLQLDLYLRDVVQNFGNFQFTSVPIDGFTSRQWMQGQVRQTRIGNSLYRVIPISTVLTAIKTGTFSVGPISASLVVQLPSGRRSRDPFFDQVFGGGEQKQITVATDAQTVQALPLPTENRPADFNNAIGTYSMTVTTSPTNLAVGDPITVRVQISGRGAPDSLALPERSWPNFKIYPPSSKPAETSDPFGLEGTKTFEQIVMPESSDIKALPAISFSFFDPEQKTYRTLMQPAVSLTVRPSGPSAQPSVSFAARPDQESPPPSQDIVSIRQRLGTVAQATPPLVQQPWFLALQTVPALAFFVAIAWRKRTEMLANNPRLRRQRHVAQLVRGGLGDLRKLAEENRSDDFFATLFHLLQEQLGERLDLPASSITEAVIEERLRPAGVPESTLTALHELFQTCNQARYAPIKDSRELAAIIPNAEGVLRELQGVKV